METGRILGVTESSVYNWECDKIKPQIRSISRIVQFLEYIPDLIPNETLGKRIVAYRTIRSISQKDLAYQIGIDPATLGRYERDESRLKGQIKKKIESFFGPKSSSPLR